MYGKISIDYIFRSIKYVWEKYIVRYLKEEKDQFSTQSQNGKQFLNCSKIKQALKVQSYKISAVKIGLQKCLYFLLTLILSAYDILLLFNETAFLPAVLPSLRCVGHCRPGGK